MESQFGSEQPKFGNKSPCKVFEYGKAKSIQQQVKVKMSTIGGDKVSQVFEQDSIYWF